MSPITSVLLMFIGYLVLRAIWRLFRVIKIGRPTEPKQSRRRPTTHDEFGHEYEIEDAHWRDLP